MTRHAQDVVFHGRIDILQKGHDVEAHLVSLHLVFKVGVVDHEFLSQAVQIIEHLLARHAEHGSEDIAVAPLHALQPAHARAPDDVEQDGLHLVVAVVGYADAVSMDVEAERSEIVVAQVTRSHFDRYLMQGGISLCVKVDFVQLDALLFA